MKHIINTAIIIMLCSVPAFAQQDMNTWWDNLFSFNIQSQNATVEQKELFIEIVIDDMMRCDKTGDGKLSRAELLKYFKFHKGLLPY